MEKIQIVLTTKESFQVIIQKHKNEKHDPKASTDPLQKPTAAANQSILPQASKSIDQSQKKPIASAILELSLGNDQPTSVNNSSDEDDEYKSERGT